MQKTFATSGEAITCRNHLDAIRIYTAKKIIVGSLACNTLIKRLIQMDQLGKAVCQQYSSVRCVSNGELYDDSGL